MNCKTAQSIRYPPPPTNHLLTISVISETLEYLLHLQLVFVWVRCHSDSGNVVSGHWLNHYLSSSCATFALEGCVCILDVNAHIHPLPGIRLCQRQPTINDSNWRWHTTGQYVCACTYSKTENVTSWGRSERNCTGFTLIFARFDIFFLSAQNACRISKNQLKAYLRNHRSIYLKTVSCILQFVFWCLSHKQK